MDSEKPSIDLQSDISKSFVQNISGFKESREIDDLRKILHILACAYCKYGAVLPSKDSILSQSKT